ncbi:hypothetical protein D9619_002166 [Psilocybe cf. subviscida]|uniref:Uncharacterized protein n=1 Tax=Psilocybe cf. subviscida TaxID=2480587 RepID=A0A8H5F306_9AGAR|nr:hypothetical protein D9619_002166 [Psilocybe cf. subviscida]
MPAHDYRDDLESFNYVLQWICATQFGHGIARPLAPDMSTRGRTPLETAALKYQSLHRNAHMTEIFGGGVRNLLNALREFCLDNYHYRFNVISPGRLDIDPCMSYSGCDSVDYDMAEYDYRAYQALIDQAIAEETRSWPVRRAWLMAQL